MVYFILDTLLDTFLDTFFGQIFCALTLTHRNGHCWRDLGRDMCERYRPVRLRRADRRGCKVVSRQNPLHNWRRLTCEGRVAFSIARDVLAGLGDAPGYGADALVKFTSKTLKSEPGCCSASWKMARYAGNRRSRGSKITGYPLFTFAARGPRFWRGAARRRCACR